TAARHAAARAEAADASVRSTDAGRRAVVGVRTADENQGKRERSHRLGHEPLLQRAWAGSRARPFAAALRYRLLPSPRLAGDTSERRGGHTLAPRSLDSKKIGNRHSDDRYGESRGIARRPPADAARRDSGS